MLAVVFNHVSRLGVSRAYVNSVAVFELILTGLAALMLGGCATNPVLDNTTTDAYNRSTFGLHDVTTFDVYVDNETVHLISGGKISSESKQTGLRYLRSEDGGLSWSEPTFIADVPAIINTRGNDAQLAAKGDNLLVLWQAKGELPGMGPLVSAYSLDMGKTWRKGENPAVNAAGDQSHSDLIADNKGNFHAVWLEDPEENGYQSLRYARSEDGISWGKALTLDDSTCSCCWNSFALSPANELNIYLRDMKPRDMALLRSADAGLSWQRISTVGDFGWQFDGCPHVGGALAYGNGNQDGLHALSWTGLEGKSGLYHLASSDNGKHWSAPKKLGKQATHGDIAAFQGDLVAIWDEMATDGSSLYYAKSSDDGATWSLAIKLTESYRAATHPRLVATANGLLALWTEKTNKQPNQLAWQLLNP